MTPRVMRRDRSAEREWCQAGPVGTARGRCGSKVRNATPPTVPPPPSRPPRRAGRRDPRVPPWQIGSGPLSPARDRGGRCRCPCAQRGTTHRQFRHRQIGRHRPPGRRTGQDRAMTTSTRPAQLRAGPAVGRPGDPPAGRPVRARQRPVAGHPRDPGRPRPGRRVPGAARPGRGRRARDRRGAAAEHAGPARHGRRPEDRRPVPLVHGRRAHRGRRRRPAAPAAGRDRRAADRSALAGLLGRGQRTGGPALFGAFVATDAKDSTRYLVHLSQSGLGLPDESYYREDAYAEIRAALRRAPGPAGRAGRPGRAGAAGRDRDGAGDRAGREVLGPGHQPGRGEDLHPDDRRRAAPARARRSTGTPGGRPRRAGRRVRRGRRAAAQLRRGGRRAVGASARSSSGGPGWPSGPPPRSPST